jgi:hypothetical protein
MQMGKNAMGKIPLQVQRQQILLFQWFPHESLGISLQYLRKRMKEYSVRNWCVKKNQILECFNFEVEHSSFYSGLCSMTLIREASPGYYLLESLPSVLFSSRAIIRHFTGVPCLCHVFSPLRTHPPAWQFTKAEALLYLLLYFQNM